MKQFISVFALLLIAGIATAQDFPYSEETVKSKPDAADIEFLKKKARQLFYPDLNIEFNFSTEDFKPEKPPVVNTPTKDSAYIADMQAKLNGTDSDYVRYNNMGQAYAKMGMKNAATDCYNKSLAIINKKLLFTPQSKDWLTAKAMVFMNAGEMQQAINTFNEILKIHYTDTMARTFLPLIYFSLGQMDMAQKVVDENLLIWPEGITGYLYYMMLRISKFYTSAGEQKQDYYKSDTFLNIQADSILPFPRLKAKAEELKDSANFAILYNSARLFSVLAKITTYSIAHGSFAFTLSKTDRQDLDELEKFFNKQIIKNHKNDNKYLGYLAMGIIETLRTKNKEAAAYFEKAIKAKPRNVSTEQNNSASAYNNLMSSYALMGDTLKIKDVALRKINNKPEIDPNPKDYITLAAAYSWENNMPAMLSNLNMAKQLNENMEDAYKGLGVYYIQQGDNATATENLNRCMAINRNNVKAFALYGISTLITGDLSTARYIFKKAWETDEVDNDMLAEILDRFYVKN